MRMEIHKRLSKHPYVQFFKDAMKEKFGYGATLVKLK
jgi:dsDNA-specific endonuclease/ATPase MutS2